MSIDNATIGSRLQTARRTLGLTQTDAGSHMGMVTSTVSAIEAGKRSVAGSELHEFSRIYQRPLTYFLQTEELSTSPGFQYLFRRVDDSVLDRSPIVELEQLASDYDLIEKLVGVPTPPLPPDYSGFGFRGERDAEALAEMERSRLGLGDAPVKDLVDILDGNVGIRVFMLPVGQKSLSGLVVQSRSGRPCVLVNSTEIHYRRNFTLAHEYAHALVHLSEPSAPKAWIDFSSKSNGKDPEERFADSFAAAFLMPRRAVFSQLNLMARGRAQEFKDSDWAHLAMHFGVSGQAMSLRLVTLRKLSRQAQRDYWQQRSFKPIAEALGYEVEDEDWTEHAVLPPRYRYLAMRGLRRGHHLSFKAGGVAQRKFLRIAR